MKTASKLSGIVMLIIFVMLTGCSRTGKARQIVAQPSLTPIAQYPEMVKGGRVAYIELMVNDVPTAVDQAGHAVNQRGGQLTNIQYWIVDGRQVATVVISIPDTLFDRLHSDLLQLGVLVTETISTVESGPFEPPTRLTAITLHLRPAESPWAPNPPSPSGWNPASTFRRAAGVFLTIFGFLADIVIWAVVVVGPFALVGVLIWLVVRRTRRNAR